MNQEVTNNPFNPQAPPQTFRRSGLARQPREDPFLVLRRDQEAGDDQLPDVQARARRSVLRAHLRPDQGLRVPVRQVQAHEVQAASSARNAAWKSRCSRSAASAWAISSWPRPRPHLVPEVAALAHRPAAGHDAADLERVLYFENYVVIEPGLTDLKGQLISEEEFMDRRRTSIGEDAFTANDRRRGHPRDAGRDRSRAEAEQLREDLRRPRASSSPRRSSSA
jgi:hypothetical protein